MLIKNKGPLATKNAGSIARSALLTSVAMFAIMPVAMAQDTGTPPEDDEILLEPISIDAKADVITGGVQLEEEDLDRINATDIKDVFRQEPGVTVGSPLTISQKVYVQGIEDTNLAVDIDGARQINKTYHHVGSSLIDPGLLKAVKIESGVAPADAGPRALGGSISYESKDGRDFVLPGETFGGYGRLSWNSNTGGFTENLALATRAGGFDFMLYGAHVNGDDYEDGNGDKVAGSAPVSESFMFKAGYTADNGYRIKLNANSYNDDSARAGRTNFTTVDLDDTQMEYRRNSVTLSFGDETPSDMWDPKAAISYTQVDTDVLTDPPFVPAFGLSAVTLDSFITSVNGKASNTFTLGEDTITTGFDFFADENEGGQSGVMFKEKVHGAGLFAQARMVHSDTLRTSFGGRYDYNDLTGTEGTTVKTHGYSVNGNVEYDITEDVMLYGGVATVYGGTPLAEGTDLDANYNYTNLEASRSYNYKAGATYDFDNWSLDGNWFMSRIDGAQNLTNSTRATTSDILTRGAVLSVKYGYDNGFVRSSVTTNTVRVDGLPPTSQNSEYFALTMGEYITLDAEHFVPEYNLRFGTSNEFFFENDDTVIEGEKLNAYFVANVFTEWAPEQVDGFTLRFDIKNLLDRNYEDRANISQDSVDAFPIVATDALNDPGRTFLLTAKIDF